MYHLQLSLQWFTMINPSKKFLPWSVVSVFVPSEIDFPLQQVFLDCVTLLSSVRVTSCVRIRWTVIVAYDWNLRHYKYKGKSTVEAWNGMGTNFVKNFSYWPPSFVLDSNLTLDLLVMKIFDPSICVPQWSYFMFLVFVRQISNK